MDLMIEEKKPTEYPEFTTIVIVSDFYNRYPGETVQIFVNIVYKKEFSNSILSIALPAGLELIDYSIKDQEKAETFVRDLSSGQVVDWHLGKKYLDGQQFEIVVQAKVQNPGRLVYLVSVAEITDSKGNVLASENMRIAVHPKGKYLTNLPEIYQDHDFIGRFLMLFESFWKPINQQINQMDLYFDPAYTPSDFLPWLGSWLGVLWDETLPDDRKRKLLQVAVRMYQRRGTKSSLEDYLQIYTNGRVDIVEHRSQNFLLGKEAKLGRAIALGSQNLPHTFTVNVKIDEDELLRMDARDRSRNENAYYQKLDQIIEDRKPAHTAYTLNLEIEKPKNSDPVEGKDA
jgi:phage tail-like protein